MIYTSADNDETFHADVINILKKHFRENEEIISSFKAQESIGVKTAQDFDKNLKLL